MLHAYLRLPLSVPAVVLLAAIGCASATEDGASEDGIDLSTGGSFSGGAASGGATGGATGGVTASSGGTTTHTGGTSAASGGTATGGKPSTGGVPDTGGSATTTCSVTFRYEGDASEVLATGTFTGWAETVGAGALEMTATSPGVFEGTTNMTAGPYEYKFVVDGVWMADPSNPETVNDNFNGVNSVGSACE